MKKNTLINFKSLLIATYMLLAVITSNAQIQKGADIDGEAAGDGSGQSVSMPDANTLAIGAYKNDGNGNDAGHVRVYNWSGTAWVKKGADINGEAAGDQSGWSVSMPDANTLAIGARANNGNGTSAGHVRVYNWSGTAWVQKGADIDGEATYDGSGESVSMPDKNTLAIGAPLNDGNGDLAGHVRVYSMGSNVDVLENSVGNTLEIYPNPAKNVINVKTADTKLLGMAYSIYDNAGKVVLSGKINSENTSIELGNLAAGIYMLSIAENVSQTFKLIKK